MLDKFKDLFKSKEVAQVEEVDARVKREKELLKSKLERSISRSFAEYNEAVSDVNINECATICESCNGTGYLTKDIRLLYGCPSCLSKGQTFWIDKCLTASKMKDYEDDHHKRIRNNIYNLMYELKQEARKLNFVALIEIKEMDKSELSVELKDLYERMNWYGGGLDWKPPDDLEK